MVMHKMISDNKNYKNKNEKIDKTFENNIKIN